MIYSYVNMLNISSEKYAFLELKTVNIIFVTFPFYESLKLESLFSTDFPPNIIFDLELQYQDGFCDSNVHSREMGLFQN